MAADFPTSLMPLRLLGHQLRVVEVMSKKFNVPRVGSPGLSNHRPGGSARP
jgi:hypothetical protein